MSQLTIADFSALLVRCVGSGYVKCLPFRPVPVLLTNLHSSHDTTQPPPPASDADLHQAKKKSNKNKDTREQEEDASPTAETPAIPDTATVKTKKKKQMNDPTASSEGSKDNSSKMAAASAAAAAAGGAATGAGTKVRVEGMSLTPLKDFAAADMPAEVMKYITDKGWTQPTLIQSHCWPALTAGRDVIGIAETGSGKTLGFSLPAMSRIFDARKVCVGVDLERRRSTVGRVWNGNLGRKSPLICDWKAPTGLQEDEGK